MLFTLKLFLEQARGR